MQVHSLLLGGPPLGHQPLLVRYHVGQGEVGARHRIAAQGEFGLAAGVRDVAPSIPGIGGRVEAQPPALVFDLDHGGDILRQRLGSEGQHIPQLAVGGGYHVAFAPAGQADLAPRIERPLRPERQLVAHSPTGGLQQVRVHRRRNHARLEADSPVHRVAVLERAVQAPFVHQHRDRRAVVVGRCAVRPAGKQEPAAVVFRVRPGESAVIAAADHNRPVLLRRSEQVDRAVVYEQVAPERIHDVGHVALGRAVVLRPIHAGEALFRLMVARAASAEIVVGSEQRTIGQARDGGAAEIGESPLRLIFDLDMVHRVPSSHATRSAARLRNARGATPFCARLCSRQQFGRLRRAG